MDFIFLFVLIFICFILSKEDSRYEPLLPWSVIAGCLVWFGLDIHWLIRLAMVFMAAGAAIDIRLMELPDSTSLCAFLCIIAYIWFYPHWFVKVDVIVSIVVFLFMLGIFIFTDGLGFGDIKILVPTLLICSLSGIAYSFIVYWWILSVISIIIYFIRKKRERFIPIGQLIVGALYLALFFKYL